MTTDERIKELERRCPGAKVVSIVPGLILLDSPRYGGGTTRLEVDLEHLGLTPDQWLDLAISDQPEPNEERDKRYRVNCARCGNVQIGYNNYLVQMNNIDVPWRCPECGEYAEFDDEAYTQCS